MKYAGAITGVIIPAETIGIRWDTVSFPIIARLHSDIMYRLERSFTRIATILHPVSRIL